MTSRIYADTVVVGGGTSGAAVAGKLVAGSDRSVILIEAGPDYGAFADGKWPAELLDARTLPLSHDWGYTNAASTGRPKHLLERARVMGGCSSHNGCAAIWGSRHDYDAWAAAGNPGWSTDELLPIFKKSSEALRVKRINESEITPIQRAGLETAASIGIPWVQDLNNLDENIGISTSPVNIVDGVRWNAGFSYVDPVRGNNRLTIMARTIVNKLRIENGRVTGLEVIGPDGPVTVEAGQVVLCGGAYGTPAILLRSGVGPEAHLNEFGITPILNLAVGENLHDHPAVYLKYSGTPKIIEAMQQFAAQGGTLFSEQTIAKFRSKYCTEAFDLHTYPVGGPFMDNASEWEFLLPVANMIPKSRGRVRLTSTDPEATLHIDTGYLSDPAGDDLKILWDGIQQVREMAKIEPLASLIGTEIAPTANLTTPDDVRRDCLHYYHAVGTCKMGPATDSTAVADSRGKVHGLDNLYVADAALIPVVPRANTNIPVLVVGERVADWLLEG